MAPKKSSKISFQEREIESDVTERFQSLHDTAVSFGLKSSDFLKLISLRQIQPQSTLSKVKAFLVLVLVLCLLLLNQALEYPVIFTDIFQMLCGGHLAIQCIVRKTDSLDTMLRPPITDCGFCKNVTNIPKLSNISTNYFYETFSNRKHPFVIVDAMEKWRAKRKFDYRFLKNLYLKVGTRALENIPISGSFLVFNGGVVDMKDLFDRVDEENMLLDGRYPWYLGWGDEDKITRRVLRRFYGVPYFLKNTRRETVTWIFLGSPGYGAKIHVDHVELPSWQGQVKGKKQWTLQPPPECFFECEGMSLQVSVDEGEMIVLETNYWYHKTLNIGDKISISIGSEYAVIEPIF